MIRRFTCGIMAGLPALFAWFQINDPDPALWVVFYGAVSTCLLLAALGTRQSWLVWTVFGAALMLAAVNAPSLFSYATNQDGVGFAQAMSYDKPYIEESRESLGALMMAAIVHFSWWGSSRRDSSAESNG